MPTENRSSNTDTPFMREDRYIVIKRSDLDRLPGLQRHLFSQESRRAHEQMFAAGAPARQLLVIESDWPEYEPAWAAIEARVTGKPVEQHQGEPSEYPPCDYCGIVPDHHPWHGSGLLSGVENRHIHACDACRGRLPLHPGQHKDEPVMRLECEKLLDGDGEAERPSQIALSLQTKLRSVESERDRLRAKLAEQEHSARELLRIIGMSVQGSAAYNRAVIAFHDSLNADTKPN